MAATKTKPQVKAKSKIDMKEGARRVLARAGKPLHYRDITTRMLKEGKVETSGKTPQQSMSAKLATCAKKEDTFKRVAPGVYDLIEREAKKNGNGK